MGKDPIQRQQKSRCNIRRQFASGRSGSSAGNGEASVTSSSGPDIAADVSFIDSERNHPLYAFGERCQVFERHT